MNTLKNIFGLILAGIVIISGCEEADDIIDDTPDSNIIEITDDIEEPTTWYGDSVYIIKESDFFVKSSLVIEPGTVIKFHPTQGKSMTLSTSAVVLAEGTVDLPIIFTSYYDDDHGGDSNEDGTETTPARADWGGIQTNSSNGSKFEYCEFYYGGNSDYSYTLRVNDGSFATVKFCKFISNDGSYPTERYGALEATTAGAGTVIQSNIFYDNIRPLSICFKYDLNNSNMFYNPDDPSQVNTCNGIFVSSVDKNISGQVIWEETDVPFVISVDPMSDNELILTSGASLMLVDNVILKFKPNSVLKATDGVSAIYNHDGTGVYFTSYNDDTHGGDTNGDGSLTSPADGDWGGIYDASGTTPDPFFFGWPNILYDEIH